MTTTTTKAERARRVAEAIHSTEMEGLTVGAATHADVGLHVERAIDSDELVARTRARCVLTAEETAGEGLR